MKHCDFCRELEKEVNFVFVNGFAYCEMCYNDSKEYLKGEM